jgi:hypothetical protein
MIRWTEDDPNRHRQQEMALLALCDRVQALEQLVTLMGDSQRQMIVEHSRALAAAREKLITQRESILVLEDRVHRLEIIQASR